MVKSETFILIKRLASQNVVCREGGSFVCAKWNNGYKLLIMVVAIVVVIVIVALVVLVVVVMAFLLLIRQLDLCPVTLHWPRARTSPGRSLTYSLL